MRIERISFEFILSLRKKNPDYEVSDVIEHHSIVIKL